MTQKNIPHCDGCERQCEFDAFTRTYDKSVYPVIGKKIIQCYKTSNNTTQYINAAEIHSYEAAIKKAHQISLSCPHYKTK